ncbi:fibroblast growth factor 23 [Nothobranchius furzeri]|uniref:Fibroblast growth factor 23 n=1 Tax=Nothobranchius furzeri TaxID=105023 RepID=A0A9D2Z079_NOTFU|nr:fibroblast growth factor 23 [Nothobranchius furzeri]KAF7229292.1 fibroblast growth factor 23 [Nothobranchius furzeri]
MDVNKRLGMRDTMLTLLLAVLQGLPVGEAAPNPSPLVGSNWGNPRRYVHLQTSTELNNFYLEIRLDGSVGKTTARSAFSVILMKAETREHVAIFGVKSNRYLCMDQEGILFSSPICQRDSCLFYHRLLENNRDVYYSTLTGILLNLEGSRQLYSAGQNLPQTSLFLPKKNTVPLQRLLLHRDKRTRVADPTDPHNVLIWQPEDELDSRAAQEDDIDLDVEVELETETEVGDDGRNVSRETPLAPHDPWNVNLSRQGGARSTGTTV